MTEQEHTTSYEESWPQARFVGTCSAMYEYAVYLYPSGVLVGGHDRSSDQPSVKKGDVVSVRYRGNGKPIPKDTPLKVRVVEVDESAWD